MARLILICVIVIFVIGVISPQKDLDVATEDSSLLNSIHKGSSKSRTFYDYQTRVVAYKDLVESRCLLEFLKSGETFIGQTFDGPRLANLSKNFFMSENVLSKRQIWTISGQRILEFCRGYPTYLIHDLKTNDQQDNVVTDGIAARTKRSTKHFFVGRVRGQTQSQYLNYGNSKDPGKAEAESTYGSSKAVVSGSSGMGQAQSQSIPVGCDECYGPGFGQGYDQQQILQHGRPGQITEFPGEQYQRPDEEISTDQPVLTNGHRVVQPRPVGPNGIERPGYPGPDHRGPLPGVPDEGINGYPPRRPGHPEQKVPGAEGPSYPKQPGFPSQPGYPEYPGHPSGPQRPEQPGYPSQHRPGYPEQTPELPQQPRPQYPGHVPHYPEQFRPGQTPQEIATPAGPQIPGYPEQPRYPSQHKPSYPGLPVSPQIPGYPEQPSYPSQYKPGYPGQPISPQTPGYPGQPSYPSQYKPGYPEQPVGPQTPGYPSQPGYPSEHKPGYPGQPVGPQIPGYPGQPSYPSQQKPGYPEQPVGPQTPGYPRQPSYPSQQKPGYPEQVIGPQTPGYPGQPSYPEQFVGPQTPGYPAQPGYPGQPSYPPTNGYPDQQQPSYPGPDVPKHPDQQEIITNGGPHGGRFGGRLSGDYSANAGHAGKFSGVFSGEYEAYQNGKILGKYQQPTGYPGVPGGPKYPGPPGYTGVTDQAGRRPGYTNGQIPAPGAGSVQITPQYVDTSKQPAGGGILETGGRPGYPGFPGGGTPGQEITEAGGGRLGIPAGTGYPRIPEPGGQLGVPGQTSHPSITSYPSITGGQLGISGQTGGQLGVPSQPGYPGVIETGGQFVLPGQTAYPPGSGGILGIPSHTAYPSLPGAGGQLGIPRQPGYPGVSGTGGQLETPSQTGYPGVSGSGGQLGTLSRPGYNGDLGRNGQLGTPSQTGYPGVSGSGGQLGTPSQPGYPGAGGQLITPVQTGYPRTPQPGGQFGPPSHMGPPSGELGIQNQVDYPGARGPGGQVGVPGVPGYPGSPGYGQLGALGQPGQPSVSASGGPGYSPVSGTGGRYTAGEAGQAGFYDRGEGGTQVDDSDSQVQTSVQQTNNETQASASAQGKFAGGTAQSQVSGTYTGSGSFNALAGSDDGKRGAMTQVSGGKEGALSSAQGRGGLGQSQAQVQLASDTGDTVSSAQTGGWNHGSQTQVQASGKGGMADAQANAPGSTSSQAQIGFTPYDENEKDDQTTPFRGGGMASAQSGTYSGQAQSQIQGKFQYGIKYTGAAQAGSGSKDSVALARNQSRPTPLSGNFPEFKPLNFTPGKRPNSQDQVSQSNGKKSIRKTGAADAGPQETEEKTVSVEAEDTATEEYHDEDYDYEPDDTTQKPVTKSIISQTSRHQRQHIVLDPLEDLDATVSQSYGGFPKHGAILQPGEYIPGSPGYQIPVGFRGRVKSIASGQNTYATGKHSQAQSVTLTPGTGRIIYKKPVYAVSSNTHFQDGQFGFGSGYTYQPANYQVKSGKSLPNFVSVTKSETGSKNPYTGQKTPSVFYSQSSSCGVFTNTCVFNGTGKLCFPKPRTNPDGTFMTC